MGHIWDLGFVLKGLKDNPIRKLLKEIIFNRRHYHISIYILCQSYLSCEKTIRKLFSNIFVFRVSKKELETIFNEVVESKKDYIYDLANLCLILHINICL